MKLERYSEKRYKELKDSIINNLYKKKIHRFNNLGVMVLNIFSKPENYKKLCAFTNVDVDKDFFAEDGAWERFRDYFFILSSKLAVEHYRHTIKDEYLKRISLYMFLFENIEDRISSMQYEKQEAMASGENTYIEPQSDIDNVFLLLNESDTVLNIGIMQEQSYSPTYTYVPFISDSEAVNIYKKSQFLIGDKEQFSFSQILGIVSSHIISDEATSMSAVDDTSYIASFFEKRLLSIQKKTDDFLLVLQDVVKSRAYTKKQKEPFKDTSITKRNLKRFVIAYVAWVRDGNWDFSMSSLHVFLKERDIANNYIKDSVLGDIKNRIYLKSYLSYMEADAISVDELIQKSYGSNTYHLSSEDYISENSTIDTESMLFFKSSSEYIEARLFGFLSHKKAKRMISPRKYAHKTKVLLYTLIDEVATQSDRRERSISQSIKRLFATVELLKIFSISEKSIRAYIKNLFQLSNVFIQVEKSVYLKTDVRSFTINKELLHDIDTLIDRQLVLLNRINKKRWGVEKLLGSFIRILASYNLNKNGIIHFQEALSLFSELITHLEKGNIVEYRDRAIKRADEISVLLHDAVRNEQRERLEVIYNSLDIKLDDMSFDIASNMNRFKEHVSLLYSICVDNGLKEEFISKGLFKEVSMKVDYDSDVSSSISILDSSSASRDSLLQNHLSQNSLLQNSFGFEDVEVCVLAHNNYVGLLGANVGGVCISSHGKERKSQLNDGFLNLVVKNSNRILLWGLLCRATDKNGDIYFILNNLQGSINNKKIPTQKIAKAIIDTLREFKEVNSLKYLLFQNLGFNALSLSSERFLEKAEVLSLGVSIHKRIRLDFSYDENGIVNDSFYAI